MARRRLGRLALVFFAVSLLAAVGCGGVNTAGDADRLSRQSGAREVKRLLWVQSQQDRARARRKVAARLAGGLTRSEAVAVALINNQRLQAAFEEVGISRAELSQAGLYENPTLTALFRWPVSGEQESGTNIEAGLSFNLADLWRVPLKGSLAEVRLQRVTLQVADQVRMTRLKVLGAYDRLFYLQKMLHLQKEMLASLRAQAAEAQRRQRFGYETALEVYVIRAAVAEAQVMLAQRRMELDMARARLTRLLGLAPGELPALKGPLPKAERPLPAAPKAVALALARRLDLKVARLRIREARRGLALQRGSLVRRIHLGASYEREVEGTAVLGPEVEIELPVFDQNRAQLAKAQFMIRQAQKKVAALEGRIRESVGNHLAQVAFLRQKAEALRARIVPLRRRSVAFARKYAGRMQLSRLVIHQSQQELHKARLELLAVELKQRQTLSRLEYQLGGRLP